MHKFLTSLALAATVLAAAPALAADEQKSVAVRHADLDLSSAAGRETFNRRVATATERVCGSYAGAINNEERAIARCRADAAQQIAVYIAALGSKAKLAAR